MPRTVARRGESSVRAVTRMMADQGGMNIAVLEEAGRSGGISRVNNKVKKQRHLFYLILFKNGREVLGFEDAVWLEYAEAARKLTNKRDQQMLRAANKLVKTVELPKAEKPEDAELEI
ncbi:MAG: hypothetical protein UV74_C0001G0079 [Candidatus Woesebacteria bacterium GW2011_GWB1_43_14]|uniref:Uncharacterized protein n=1 Tax=Candidatus Woesebacteria bacterium GW2011_GWB1_43_14 TaxID=1618578 RepID=A0A0G1DMT5_9BACT|nr:MAG: hypothetical protein UV51_C0002G0068 [Candidatus Woesebacteria bacterium GW2011_GWC1_42_9]KKS98969.1 MAG: hypothetical protein UV74_C0001G0079 [Candidatus Woesebacteria bacterium GW2011_GWB1_43_14]